MNENNVMLFLLLVISFLFLSILFAVTLVFTYKKIKRLQELETYANVLKGSLAANSNTLTHQNAPTDPTHLTQTLLLEILPSKSAKWERLLSGDLNGLGPKPGSVEEQENVYKTWSVQEGGPGKVQHAVVSGRGSGQVVVVEEEDKGEKKKKKKGKKKRVDLNGEHVVGEENGGGRENLEPGMGVPEMGFLRPFTSMGSPTQRKIKELYRQLVQSCESDELTLTQVFFF